MICGESYESYDMCVFLLKSSMNDDKKDQHMDSASSAGISLQDFLNDYACNIQCIT